MTIRLSKSKALYLALNSALAAKLAATLASVTTKPEERSERMAVAQRNAFDAGELWFDYTRDIQRAEEMIPPDNIIENEVLYKAFAEGFNQAQSAAKE